MNDVEAAAELKALGLDIDNMATPERISLGAIVVIGRLIKYGSTMEARQISDVLNAVMGAHRNASALDFIERVVLKDEKAMASAPPILLQVYLRLSEDVKRRMSQAHNLLEMAALSEKPQ